MLSVTPGYRVLEIAHNADRRWWGRHGRPVLRSASALRRYWRSRVGRLDKAQISIRIAAVCWQTTWCRTVAGTARHYTRAEAKETWHT